jgi:lipoprotein-anchoring transpeptidase ErfK/SrfK
MSNRPLNTIRRFVNNGRLLKIAGTLLAALVVCSCEEYPPPYEPGFYPRAIPAGWWNDDGASGSAKIVVHIGEQKAYFYKGRQLVGETTVSTGKPGFSTPPGRYTVLSKDAGHVSTVFGDYVDDYGNVVRSNIDSRKDPRPKGTHFDGARMPYAMFFRSGYAMHQGYVPPFAASHGCIRLPGQMAVRFFENAPVGTPVTVTE